jgi:ABC-type transport system involved in multi-copper enzyme maturation permease subunit
MRLFLEFFNFELKFRFKSISTYVYFAIWFAFSFLCIASENFGPIAAGNGKVLLNGPYANIYDDVFASFFGLIIIGAIFGTSILRDFQRDTTQILFTKPITKFAYLGGRWAGSFVATAFAFSGLIFGEWLGTFAPWADHTRIAPNHLSWYLAPFVSTTLVQIFFVGSLFFMVAALTRRIFIVYVQGAAFLILYLIGLGAFSATRSTALFWPGVFDPVGIILNDSITRYWTVVEKNTLLYSWSLRSAGGVFFYNRMLWICFGFLTLGLLWKFFPMSLEALTARTSSKRARIALEQDEELKPVRSRAVA